MTNEKGITIAHITDTHIDEDDAPVRDADVRGQFEKVLDSAAKENPDLIILGGDLAAKNGEIGAYRWIRDQLLRLDIPYYIIPGNHDINSNLEEIFTIESACDEGLCFLVETGVGLLVGLDSSSGVIGDSQLSWLENRVSEKQKPLLLFMHHPPIDCGCLFMDSRYPLENRDVVYKRLAGIPGIKGIFCGHYHTEKSICRSGTNIFLTPSTMHQISQDQEGYEVSSKNPGWRLIEWTPVQLSTRVSYLY